MKSLKFFFFLFFTLLFLMIRIDKVYGQDMVCSGYVGCCMQVIWDCPDWYKDTPFEPLCTKTCGYWEDYDCFADTYGGVYGCWDPWEVTLYCNSYWKRGTGCYWTSPTPTPTPTPPPGGGGGGGGGTGPYCGNGVCEPGNGEDCSTCPGDCGSCGVGICSMDLLPNSPLYVSQGGSKTLRAHVSINTGTVDYIDFSSSNRNVIREDPGVVYSPPPLNGGTYTYADVTANAVGDVGQSADLSAETGGSAVCQDTTRITIVEAPWCTVTVNPADIPVGQVVRLTRNLTKCSTCTNVSSLWEVTRENDNPPGYNGDADIVDANGNPDPSNRYAKGVKEGLVRIRNTVVVQNAAGDQATCRDAKDFNVVSSTGWWQAKDADIFSRGQIVSRIPSSCTGSCIPSLILDGEGGFPGVAVYKTGLDYGSGNLSSKNWSAQTGYNTSRSYSFSFFKSRLSSLINLNHIETPFINGSYLSSGGEKTGDYYWYFYDGEAQGQDLTIQSDLIVPAGRKIILMVKGADLYLKGKINIEERGNGFLLVLVGRDSQGGKGNIFIDPVVGGFNDNLPELEGLFLADGTIYTGTQDSGNDLQLHIRGSIVAHKGVALQRRLSDNSTTPAEFFEYAPELIYLYPSVLKDKKFKWKEVAP